MSRGRGEIWPGCHTLSWLQRSRSRSLGPPAQGSLTPSCKTQQGWGWGNTDVPPRASSKQDNGQRWQSRPAPGGSVVGVHSPHRCSDEGNEWALEVSFFCSAQLPGDKAVKWCPSTTTPLRASQVDQESTDTYNRAWRTWGAPDARRTLQRKPREMDEEAQAPQSPGSR